MNIRVILFFFLTFFSSHLIEAQESMPKKAYNDLLQGNKRAVEDKSIHKDYLAESKLIQLAQGQEPKAIIVTCSDSRAVPEIFFDQGLGDLFVIRVAGNVIAALELESIKYAATILKAPLVVVLGHQNCGAVEAVLKEKSQIIPMITKKIKSAFSYGKIQKSDTLKKATEANVSYVVEEIKKQEFIKSLMDKDLIDVKGAYFEITSGKVSFFQ
jgi:carbonic anhydrase